MPANTTVTISGKKFSEQQPFEQLQDTDRIGGYRPDAEPEEQNGVWTAEQVADYVGSKLPAGGATTTYLADTNIILGRLVARTATGIKPYDAANLNSRHTLLGVALQSAAAGAQVKVQELPGLITIPGWGLSPNTVYRAGVDGQLTTTSMGLAYTQIIGRATSADELLFSPQIPIKTN